MSKYRWKRNYVSVFSVACLLSSLLFSTQPLSAQQGFGYIQGRAVDSESRQALPFANILLLESRQGTATDSSGYFSLRPVRSGSFTLRVTSIGYQEYLREHLTVTAGDTLFLELRLEAAANELQSVMVQAAPFTSNMETPISLRNLRTTEIERNPGSDNDISKIIQTLPGVASTASFRNDLIIRGGAPNENRFFLDDIEIPVINHLVTQGASGGAFSIINANHLREVDYLSASFPANRGNALSSVFNFFP